MIAKLTKYEFRSSIKLMSMIWGALIVVSILFAITEGITNARTLSTTADVVETSRFGLYDILTTTTIMLYSLIACAIVVITVLIIIQRFYNSLLGDEGYLINTLPVKMWQIITSKGIAATCLVIMSFIVGIISIMIMAHASMFNVFKELAEMISKDPMIILIVIEVIFVCVLGVIKSIYQIYASIAIGQLVNRHRVLSSIGSYIGISIALTIIASVLFSLLSGLGIVEKLYFMMEPLSDLNSFHLVILGIALLEIIQIVPFHIVSERILSCKLNLL